jgi:hypothetical protein
LATEVIGLVQAPEKVSAMEEASRKLARGVAATAAVGMIEELMEGK